MPRSTKAESKKATTKRRTTKRSASEQPTCYDIPKSPQSSTSEENLSISRQPSEASHTNSQLSPTRSVRGRSASTAPTTVGEDEDITPKQSKLSYPTGISKGTKPSSIPGLEALDAVNELYTKLKESQAELQQLREEQETLSTHNRELDAKVSILQSELKAEKDKLKRVQTAYSKEAETVRKDNEGKLEVVLQSLQAFGAAALRIMPLLDVLTGAADIEYDDDTEKLYQIMKQFQATVKAKSDTNVKTENK